VPAPAVRRPPVSLHLHVPTNRKLPGTRTSRARGRLEREPDRVEAAAVPPSAASSSSSPRAPRRGRHRAPFAGTVGVESGRHGVETVRRATVAPVSAWRTTGVKRDLERRDPASDGWSRPPLGIAHPDEATSGRHVVASRGTVRRYSRRLFAVNSELFITGDALTYEYGRQSR
jgi:hypothetical protein